MREFRAKAGVLCLHAHGAVDPAFVFGGITPAGGPVIAAGPRHASAIAQGDAARNGSITRVIGAASGLDGRLALKGLLGDDVDDARIGVRSV